MRNAMHIYEPVRWESRASSSAATPNGTFLENI